MLELGAHVPIPISIRPFTDICPMGVNGAEISKSVNRAKYE